MVTKKQKIEEFIEKDAEEYGFLLNNCFLYFMFYIFLIKIN